MSLQRLNEINKAIGLIIACLIAIPLWATTEKDNQEIWIESLLNGNMTAVYYNKWPDSPEMKYRPEVTPDLLANELHAPPPKYLYHWSYQDFGPRFDFEKGEFRRKTSGSTQGTFPFLQSAKHGGLYVHHTLNAFAGGEREFYGPILNRFEIDPAARILIVQRKDSTRLPWRNPGEQGRVKDFDVNKYDLVYSDLLGEWLILNPKIILSYTSKGEDLRNELNKAIQQYLDPHFKQTWLSRHASPIGGVHDGEEALFKWPTSSIMAAGIGYHQNGWRRYSFFRKGIGDPDINLNQHITFPRGFPKSPSRRALGFATFHLALAHSGHAYQIQSPRPTSCQRLFSSMKP